jgi:short-subunit dehydrogenase
MCISSWSTPLSYIGLAALAYITLHFTRQATPFLLRSTLTARYNRPGTNWALVTGATDGIGFGFCEELCARGFNVILHGRNRAKLQRRVSELNQRFPTRKTGIIVLDVVDLTSSVDGVADEVSAILAAYEGQLTVLVNNVGGDGRPSGTLDSYSFKDMQETIAKNANFVAQITRILLPLLAAGDPGVVLNISSVAAWGLPYVTIYAATKGFVDTFTYALQAECNAEGLGVEVLGLRVGQVSTPGYPVALGWFVPTPRVMAQAGLNRIGCGQVIVYGYFWHWVQGLAFEMMPRWALNMVTTAMLKAVKFQEEDKAKSS